MMKVPIEWKIGSHVPVTTNQIWSGNIFAGFQTPKNRQKNPRASTGFSHATQRVREGGKTSDQVMNRGSAFGTGRHVR